MKHFDVLDRDLDIFGKHFLEASAGTGKTFALENLVCRLLLHPEKSIPIEKILIVTFTKASTREIKARIRSTLEKVKHYLIYDPTALDYVASLQERGEVQEALRKAEDALANFTQAQIYTIHGFCYRMLQEFAFTADIGLHITDVEDFGYKAIAKERVKDFLRLGLSNSYSPVQVEKILRKEGYDVDSFAEKLVKMIEKGTHIPSNISFSEAVEQVQGKLQEISKTYSVRAEDFLQDYTRVASCYKKMTSQAFEKQALFLGELLQEKVFADKDISLLLQQEELFLEGMKEGNKKLRGSFPEKNTLHYPDIFAELREEIYPIFEKMNDTSCTMLRMGRDFQELWEKKQNAVELFSPDDIVKKMAKSVENTEFVSEIQKKYDACVIDEFQDTDTLQWKIFRTLFLDPQNPIRSLCFVGDPKQSIYSFRKADLYTYLQAKEEVGESCVLSTNYRSQPSLVKALNTLFSSETVKSWIRLPSLNTEMEYTHVKAAPHAEEEVFEDGKASLHFFIAESPLGREKKWPTSEMEEK
ncbi:MAG: UvrD-helicase domain-containing protein [Chlamydiae bacterium]|nr:UvrD-helicase domain-containing protein [Chlamydiota bacterium]